MKRWFCGFSSVENNSLAALPKPLDGEMLWQGTSPFWVCGNWAKQQIITLSEGSVQLAIVGTCLEPHESLIELFYNTVRSHDYSRLMKLPGNYNLIVKDDAETYVFTDVAGLRPVFYTVYDSVVVYSSLAIPLQQLIKAEVDLSWLATYLVFLTRPNEVQNRSPFCNVQSIPPGHYLQISAGKPTCKRYWKPPEKYISFSEAAEQLREQLITAVEGRVRLYGSISSDLSGGFDSTSLALLAAKSLEKQGQKLHTITFKSVAAAESEDVRWAENALGFYRNIAATMIEGDEIPAEYSNLESTPLTDAPNPAIVAIAKFNYEMELIRSKGSQLHMSGEGGDAVLLAPDSYLIDLLKRIRLGTFLQHTYGQSRLTYLSPLVLISSVVKLSLTSYQHWLLQQAKELATREISNQQLVYQETVSNMFSWDFVPYVASWYTNNLVDSVVGELKRWATVATPFANCPWKNQYMAEICLTGSATVIQQQLAENFDVNLEFPYLDSLVIDACLSAKPEERTTPFTYKPLLSNALQKDLPKSVFTRITKGDYTTDELTGFRQYRAGVKELFQTSLLADIGLIDIENFRANIERFAMGIYINSINLNQTMAVELWLRSLVNSGNSFWNSRNT
jgi:asparagine synthase (glutamine-hydrolysing)